MHHRTLEHVLLLGQMSYQNWTVGFSLHPKGGISDAPVANINTADKVIEYPECCKDWLPDCEKQNK